MTETTIQTKISKLAEKMEDGRPDAIAEIQAMQKVFKNAELIKNLSKNPAMTKLLATLQKREQSFTTLLANKEDLTTEQRNAYFARRKEVRFILSFFDSADKTLQKLESTLDYQLTDEVDETVDN